MRAGRGEIAEEDGVDDAENAGVETNAECKRQHRNGSKRRVFAGCADRIECPATMYPTIRATSRASSRARRTSPRARRLAAPPPVVSDPRVRGVLHATSDEPRSPRAVPRRVATVEAGMPTDEASHSCFLSGRFKDVLDCTHHAVELRAFAGKLFPARRSQRVVRALRLVSERPQWAFAQPFRSSLCRAG